MNKLLLLFALAAGLHAQRALQPTQATAVASASATSVTSSVGLLASITVGTPIASATVKIYDLSSANCTGTPSNPLYTLTTPATAANPYQLVLNLQIQNGICVLSSSASQLITVNYN